MKRDDILLKVTEAKKLTVMEFLVDGKTTAVQSAKRLHTSVRRIFSAQSKKRTERKD